MYWEMFKSLTVEFVMGFYIRTSKRLYINLQSFFANWLKDMLGFASFINSWKFEKFISFILEIQSEVLRISAQSFEFR